ncbi:hypothetical protein CLV72_110153 [Allonocardiopsis opalescens]|uniref:Metalloprotease n=1 Tax=Allonocardiopsis opalescens TaxID=1144618 RepID=A0A2T0PU23_9ACTN|nr:hypothetical protein CLV72_110153 [Allonocardiopsis opalescens]
MHGGPPPGPPAGPPPPGFGPGGRPPGRRGVAPLSAFIGTAVAAVALALLLVLMWWTPGEGAPGQAAPPEREPGDRGGQTASAAPPPVWESARNPLYAYGPLPSVDCDTPRLSVTSHASWTEFAPAVGACLDDMWGPQFAALGRRPASPEYAVADAGADSECGPAPEDALGFYCSAEHTIYIVVDQITEMAAFWPDAQAEGVWIGLVAHEYAHYVQDRVEILDHAYRLGWESGERATEQEMSRRTELQAECLSAAGLAALGRFDTDDRDRFNAVLNSGGDSETHGSTANRREWFRRGWHMETVSDCNTFTASDAEVA